MRNTLFSFLVVAVLLLNSGCAELSNTVKGTAIGAGAGAAIGGIIGKATGKTTTGVLVGGAVGATAGAIIGRQMDKQAEELEKSLEGANVERLGDGIQVTFDAAILFAVNSSDLTGEAKASLANLATSLKEYPNTRVLIAGHTDNTGAAAYNLTLSEKRAASAAAVLAENGVDPSRLEITGLGITQPKASNDTVEGRRENRRVEVAIYASEEFVKEAAAGSGSGN